MENNIIVNYSATQEKISQLLSDIQTEITSDVAIQYDNLLQMFQDSKGDAADKLRLQLNQEKIMVENLASLLTEMSQYILDSATLFKELDYNISTHYSEG